MSKPVGIVFFDGNCGFCNRWVRLLLKWDQREQFIYCNLNLDDTLSKQLKIQEPLRQVDSIVLVQEGKVFYRSDAVFKILIALGGWWTLFKIYRLIPRLLRDGVYELIAKHRYTLNAKNSSCSMADFENSHRIIQNKLALDFLIRSFS
ncbi:MAG: DCC1-like thiol-disulfide oxidoreductase family protein [Saprospiraceae bacterium]